ncbi:glutathione S-transferase family protein [Candidatus Liberibacter sp.]|uniref:glutathione S-transferase family protein n=1 Tax=Candidatus Liberibacter sp. TaxID=34022 RepID=UPI0015F77B44|nr:glutathione S-transferase family protein [Candidatus Liberibacter sp.]MBA5724658.1 glutathione S-transferase family protein [Candidatus Liberibacter sp.]
MSTLYHHPMSSNSRFIRLILSEYGLETDLVEEFPWEKRRNFLEFNPAGILPIYIDDSMQAICGSIVISEYLDDTHGITVRKHRLLAENPLQRSEIRRLTEWFMQKMEQDVTRPLIRERVYKLQMTVEQGGGPPDSKVLRIARNNIREHMKYITWLVKSRTWLAGDLMSYADFAAAAAISVLDYLGEIDWEHSPFIKEWYQRIKSRPSFRYLLSERVRGLAPVSYYTELDF